MANILPRVKARIKELLPYFAKEYVKAYKTAVVLSLRDKQNGVRGKPGEVPEPEYHVMMSNDRLVKNPQMESLVWIGEGLKKQVKWTMNNKYIITEVVMKEEKEKKDAGAASPDGAASPASAATPMSPGSPPASPGPNSPNGADETEEENKEELRVWLDDSCTEVCMNPACGEKFNLLKRRHHCRLCGEIFCSKCSDKKIKETGADGKTKEERFCEPCYVLRTTPNSMESAQPLLQKPKIKTRQLNFNGYKVSLAGFETENSKVADSGTSKIAGSAGKFLLVLTHRRSTRPQPTIAFNTAKERDEWRALLNAASRYAPQPLTTDPILRKAFQQSFQKLRWHAYVWGWYENDGSESELIADLLWDVLEVDILRGEFSKMGELPRKIARKAVIGAIEGAVSAAWSGIQKGLGEVRGPIEKAAESMLAPIFEQEQVIKGKVQPPMEEASAKALDSAEEQVEKAFASNLPIIFDAGERQLQIISGLLQSLITTVGNDHNSFSWKWSWDVVWRVSWTHSYEQEGITRQLEAALCGEVSSYETRRLCSDLVSDLKNLALSAFKVMEKKIKELGPDAGTEVDRLKRVYPEVIRLVGLDLDLLFRYRLEQCLDALIRPNLVKAVNDLINKLCEPLMSAIPDLIKDVLDPARTCKEVVEDVLRKTEENLIRKATSKICADLIRQAEEASAKGL